jgi:multidrug efflux pump subunit AcrA (membrane-fusion protein)
MTFRVRARRRWWVLAAAIAAIAGITASYQLLNRQEAASAPPPTIQTGRGDVTSSVVASGKVQPVATRELAFSRAGTVKAVNVKAGDTVTAGQALASIDPADAQQAVDEAEDALAEAKQNLADAEAAAASAAGSAASQVSQVTQASQTSPVSPTPSASPVSPVSPTPSAPPVSPTPSAPPHPTNAPVPAPSRTAAPRSDAIYSAETAVNKAQLELDRARRVLSGTTISAPVSGKVLKINGKPGDVVDTATFITLGVVEQMMVEAAFAEADAVSLAVGQPAQVKLANRPNQTFPVTIAQVAALGTVSNKLVRYTVLLAFDAPPADLLIGQSATATVVLQRSPGVLRLPQSAVRMTAADRGEVKLPDGTVRPVGVGLRGDGHAEITSGLTEGETVRLNAR